MDFFLWGDLKECIYAAPPRVSKISSARLQAAVTAVFANMLRHVGENAMWCTAFCFEMDVGCFEHLL
jgi:hypothetical protein